MITIEAIDLYNNAWQFDSGKNNGLYLHAKLD